MSNAEYLKRYAAPKAWPIDRKTTKYVAKPNPGAHSLSLGMPIGVVLRELGHCSTAREVRRALLEQDILVDGRRVRDSRFPVGLMDIISLKASGDKYMVGLDHKGRLSFGKVSGDAASRKVCRVTGKTVMRGGKLQLNLFDGRNVLLEKADFNVGDSVVLDVPSQKIVEHLPLKAGAHIFLTGGRHVGTSGVVQEVAGDVVTFKRGAELLRTERSGVFVVPASYVKMVVKEL